MRHRAGRYRTAQTLRKLALIADDGRELTPEEIVAKLPPEFPTAKAQNARKYGCIIKPNSREFIQFHIETK
jgi:hypothetical protein